MESKSNILVVDNNPDKLNLIKAALNLSGYSVSTATDGDEALIAIESYQTDLVITAVMRSRLYRTKNCGHPFSVLMITIDSFKDVNDTYGHDAGDDPIRRLSKVLCEGTRGIDLAARIGGEEFAVLLAETSKEGGFEVAERLRTGIKVLEIPTARHITASFGVAECPTDAQTAAGVLKAADVALYEAKRNGRDRVVAMEPRSNSMAAGDVQGDGN